MNNFDDSPLIRVPANKRLPLLSVAMVHLGMLTTFDQLVLGCELGSRMALIDAFTAILLASLVSGVLTFAIGYAGMREGLSATMLSRWCGFGRHGSVLTGLLVALSLLGWFSVQNAIFARSLSYALDGKLSVSQAAMLSGSLVTLLTACGFRALRLTASLAIPLFIALTGWLIWHALRAQAGSDMVASPETATLTLGGAITLLTGGTVLISLMTPDLTRFSRSGKDVLAITLLTILLGECAINGAAILIARALHSSNILLIITQATSVFGLFAVAFSMLHLSNLNLYCSTLSMASASNGISSDRGRYSLVALLLGFSGTLCSQLGIADRFIDLLALLGTIFPPMLGVMVVDYFLLQTHWRTLAQSRGSNTLPADPASCGWPALLACAAGSLTALLTETGIPVVNSLLIACLIYPLLTLFWRAVHRPQYRTS